MRAAHGYGVRCLASKDCPSIDESSVSSAAPPLERLHDAPSQSAARRSEFESERIKRSSLELADPTRRTDSVVPLPVIAASLCSVQPEPEIQLPQSIAPSTSSA